MDYRALSLVLALGAFMASGCGSDTGIIVAVERNSDSSVVQPDSLRFFVGRQGEDSRGFVDDPEELVDVGQRDLSADPYRLLIKPPGQGEETIMVAVLAFKDQEVVGVAALPNPVGFVDGMVQEWTVVLQPDDGDFGLAGENGCLIIGEGEDKLVIASPSDKDCDGEEADTDCNDNDPTVNHEAPELCETGIDENCNGVVDEVVDADEDGFENCGGDCDDSRADVNPEAPERCDGLDNNCNGDCDEGHDVDDDLYTTCGSIIGDEGLCIEEPGEGRVDCDDKFAGANPGIDNEECDGRDNNCNGECDEGYDEDGDHYSTCGSLVFEDECLPPSDSSKVDCDDTRPSVNPGAVEICDGLDNNCDGERLTEGACFQDTEGVCREGLESCDDSDGQGVWVGECSVDESDWTVEDQVCTAYQDCIDEEGNGGECALIDSAEATIECNLLLFVGEGGITQCPGAKVVVLSDPGIEPCGLFLWPELTNFVAGIGLSPLGPFAESVDQCVAYLRVSYAGASPIAGPEDLFIEQAFASSSKYYHIVLSSEVVEACPEVPLNCDSLINAGPGM